LLGVCQYQFEVKLGINADHCKVQDITELMTICRALRVSRYIDRRSGNGRPFENRCGTY